MRHRPERRPAILLCPQCRSTHVVYEAGLITGQVYHCLDCNYVGSLILEIDQPDPKKREGDPPP